MRKFFLQLSGVPELFHDSVSFKRALLCVIAKSDLHDVYNSFVVDLGWSSSWPYWHPNVYRFLKLNAVAIVENCDRKYVLEETLDKPLTDPRFGNFTKTRTQHSEISHGDKL